MKKKITNKLVRDKIPNILMEQGKAFKAHPLHGADFSKQLVNKLIEEAIELKAALEDGIHLSSIEPLSFEECENLDKDVLEEFADVFEVFTKLMKVENFKIEDLEKAVKEKREKNGGFENQIFLEWFEDKKEKK